MTTSVTINNGYDAHAHFRKGKTLPRVAPYTIKQFSGAQLMPNLGTPHILSRKILLEYKKEVYDMMRQLGTVNEFLPTFTYYLSPDLKVSDIRESWNEREIAGIKYYPKGGTTGSDKGLQGFNDVRHIITAMETLGIPLLIHGETPQIDGEAMDDYEREAKFYETEMTDLIQNFSNLNITLEHITTAEAVIFAETYNNVRATITAHHLLFDYRAMTNGVTVSDVRPNRTFFYDPQKNGLYPPMMCRPILKGQKHVIALRNALIRQYERGTKKFGLGTDTAPHFNEAKYCDCGACGVFTAPLALEMYAMSFEEMNILDHLSVFASEVMPEFYGIKDQLPNKTVVLTKQPTEVLLSYENVTTPFAGQTIPWRATSV